MSVVDHIFGIGSTAAIRGHRDIHYQNILHGGNRNRVYVHTRRDIYKQRRSDVGGHVNAKSDYNKIANSAN